MSDLIEVHIQHLQLRHAEMTVRARERLLWFVHEWLPEGIDNAHPTEIAEFFNWPAWSDETRATYWYHLQGYYRWGVLNEYFPFNPLDRLDRPRRGRGLPDPITDDEWRIAYDRSPEQPWRMLLMLGAYAGLRAGEACRLLREDVTEESVYVRHGKGGQEALVPTSPELWEFVKDRPAGPLARSVKGLALTPKSVTSNQYLHWRRIGLPSVHLHRARHRFGTMLLAAGVDIRVIQELMRHRNIQSTTIYTLVASEQRRLAIRTLPAPTTALERTAA